MKKRENDNGWEEWDGQDPHVKRVGYVILGLGITFGVIYLSKYFMSAAAEGVTAYKKLRRALQGSI